MIKKMRDLTDDDIKKVCFENHKKYGTCYNCPLQIGEDSCFINVDLDKEIEVKEE